MASTGYIKDGGLEGIPPFFRIPQSTQTPHIATHPVRKFLRDPLILELATIQPKLISSLSGLRTSESAAIPMFKRLSSDDNRDRVSSFLQNRTFQAPTRRDLLRLTQGDYRLVDNTSAPPRHTLLQSGGSKPPEFWTSPHGARSRRATIFSFPPG